MSVNETIELTNLDFFQELYEYIKRDDVTLNDTLKEFGGSNYYIPSYKTVARNDEIIAEYKEHYGTMGLAKKLAKKYDLSEAQIYLITKEVRESPSLFIQ
jgi:Mor family transcriptional regulator